MTAKDILKEFRTNPELKREVVSEIVSSREFIDEIAKAVFTHPAKAVGLDCPGTISEFFLTERVESGKEKT